MRLLTGRLVDFDALWNIKVCCLTVYIVLDEDRAHCNVARSCWSNDQGGPTRLLFTAPSGSPCYGLEKSGTGNGNDHGHKLKNIQRMEIRVFVDEPTCRKCGEEEETVEHLMFD